MKNWLKTQIRQPSTWRGILLVASVVVPALVSDELGEAVEELLHAAGTLVTATIGVWAILRRGQEFGEPTA